MSPISHGRMLASGLQGINPFAELRILFLGQNVIGLIQALGILHNFIDDLNRTDAKVVVYTTVSDVYIRNSQQARIIELDTSNKAAVLDYATSNNIDIIFDPDKVFTKKERFKQSNSFIITSDAVEHVVQVESYLTGHSIPWNFADPVWHINWLYKYTHQPGISPTAFELISIGQNKGYSAKQMEFVRALANKAMHIEHAREYLYYYLQLKRRAFRAGNSNNDFSFELTYHLTNYSIYICSAMDILARLINDKYELGFGRFQAYGISKPEFIQRLAAKRKTLADIFSRKKFQKWADWMFVRRNHITHESNLYLTPMIMKKKDVLTVEELERLVDGEFDWDLYQTVQGIDVAGMRAVVKQNLDLKLNYKTVVTDMMTLEQVNRVTHISQTLIVFPLRAIDEDFRKLNDVLTRAIHNLAKARK